LPQLSSERDDGLRFDSSPSELALVTSTSEGLRKSAAFGRFGNHVIWGKAAADDRASREGLATASDYVCHAPQRHLLVRGLEAALCFTSTSSALVSEGSSQAQRAEPMMAPVEAAGETEWPSAASALDRPRSLQHRGFPGHSLDQLRGPYSRIAPPFVHRSIRHDVASRGDGPNADALEVSPLQVQSPSVAGRQATFPLHSSVILARMRGRVDFASALPVPVGVSRSSTEYSPGSGRGMRGAGGNGSGRATVGRGVSPLQLARTRTR
jgi:hypothetical protein